MSELEELIKEMQSYGLLPDITKIYHAKHGVRYRCRTKNKPQHKNGEYCIYYNTTSIGAYFIDYQVGIKHKWHSKQQNLSTAERQSRIKSIQDSKRREEVNKQRSLYKLRQRYNQFKILDQSSSHQYLQKKNINHWLSFCQTHRLRMDNMGNLIMPVYNIDNNLMGYQAIDPRGGKKFIYGSQITGNFYLMIPCGYGYSIKDCGYLFVGESLGNMITCYLMMNEHHYIKDCNYGCVVAGTVHNIEATLCSIWSKYDHFNVILIADNDCGNLENTGVNTCNEIMEKYKDRYAIQVYIPKHSEDIV